MTSSIAETSLSTELKRKLLLTILESRHGDLCEESLNRQGKGHFHVSGRGHEAVAVLGMLMQPDDYVCPYYRDRALVLGRGVRTRQLALDYMAKRELSSHGRQMPSHFSHPEFHIWSVPAPTASQLLPACGMAWGMQLDGKKSLTIGTVGDAATRQGDFYEAVAFAKERQLPLLLVVEDNGDGISSPTRRTNPLAMNVLANEEWVVVDGWDVEHVYNVVAELMARIRAGEGPAFLWIKMERLSSHTSSDDQKLYRSSEELSTLDERDPLRTLKEQLIAAGELTADEFVRLETQIREKVRGDYAAAERAENPLPSDLEANVVNVLPEFDEEIFKPGRYRMGDMINFTLRAGLDTDPRRVIFGEDVEDPKGGVFTLTKKLSTDFPEQVFNSPLAESTILGVACGLASYGRRPVFELQFIDFIYPGWNQLVTNLATLRWRTFGKWTCPAVIYAPYGAYLPGGSLWHSQANEAAIAHYPGLNVVIPSTPEDAAGLLWTAMHAEDPTLVLIPKHMLWAERDVKHAIVPVPIGHARRVTDGTEVTIVAWGNTVEKSLEAIAQLGDEVSVDLIDLRSIAPWDREMIEESVRKTGRLIVVQEDTENCSVGQMIIAHLLGRPDVWSRMVSPPVLVSKGNVMIGYNPIYEYAALPDTKRVVEAVRRVMTGVCSARPRSGPAPARDGRSGAKVMAERAVEPESGRSGRTGDSEAPASRSDAPAVANAPDVPPGRRAPRFTVPSPENRVAPALSPAITRRLAGVVPANIQLDASWTAIRTARQEAKQRGLDYSPSMMFAWCVTRAMEQHAPFRRLVTKDGTIVQQDAFDVGVAVALEGDRLGTAAIAHAGSLSWPEFVETYSRALAEVRAGRIDDVQTPLNITSLGSFGVEVATPIVVPPSMATLFIGKAHDRLINDGGVVYPTEVITLSLTFDHKVVNGGGAAGFLNSVKKEIGEFKLPA